MQIKIIIRGRGPEQTGKCLASLEDDLRLFSTDGIETFLVCHPGSLDSHGLPDFASLALLDPGENWYQAVNRLAALPFAPARAISESALVLPKAAVCGTDCGPGRDNEIDRADPKHGKDQIQSAQPCLLLLDASACLEPGSLTAMLDCLARNPNILGVNPLFLTPDRSRLVSAGTVVDSAGQLHCLYAGLPCQNNGHDSGAGIKQNDAACNGKGSADLEGRQRFFQLAAGACLLLRLPAFLAAGGFRNDLEQLSLPDLCKRLSALKDQHPSSQANCKTGGQAGSNQVRHAIFATATAAKACLADRYCFWLEYGIWNSLIWRGKLQQDIFCPDYHLQVATDGLEYSCNQWLLEGPANHPPAREVQSDTKMDAAARSDQAWWQWQASQDPVHLLAFLGSLSGPELRQAIRLCHDIPQSLPRAFAWYKSRAEKLLCFAGKNGLDGLAAAAKNWLARARRFHHGTLRPAMRLLQKAGLYETSIDNCPAVYDAWIELVEPGWTSAKSLARGTWAQTGKMRPESGDSTQNQALAGPTEPPTIAIVMPVWNPEPEHLRAAIDSVLAQKYRNWQLCIADDASTRPEIPVILREYAARESRIRLTFRQENGHICRATNSAIALAEADWIAFMDNDDLLTPDALQIVADYIMARPEARFFFSDEDKIDGDGIRRNAVFKSVNLTLSPLPHGHLTIAASDLVAKVQGCRPGFEGSQDFDFGVRCCQELAANEICHIPHILYHWRVHANSTTAGIGTKPYLLEATKKVLREYWQKLGHTVQVHKTKHNNFFNVALTAPKTVSTSLILINAMEKKENRTSEDRVSLNCHDFCEMLTSGLAEKIAGLKKEPSNEFLAGSFFCCRDGQSDHTGLARILVELAKMASGEILLFLTPDLLPADDCDPAQLLAMAAAGHYSTVGSVLLGPERQIWHTGLYPDRSGQPFAFASGTCDSMLKSLAWGQLLVPHTVLAPAIQGLAIRKNDLLSGDFRPEYGPLALAGYCLAKAKAGLPALVSPWGQWYVDPARAVRFEDPAVWAKLAPADPDDQPAWLKAFLRDHGADVRSHPLLNPCLKAAPDNGWGLVFPLCES